MTVQIYQDKKYIYLIVLKKLYELFKSITETNKKEGKLIGMYFPITIKKQSTLSDAHF